jgi:hypothetical protein
VDLRQINPTIPINISPLQLTPSKSLSELNLIHIRTRHSSQTMWCVKPSQRLAIEIHTNIINALVAIKISKADGEVE